MVNICIIIPVHNEAQEIGKVVKSIKENNYDVVVIDDGSIDDSSTIAKESGAVVLRNEIRVGKGLSLQKGFEYALNQQYGGVITMDGDGQHAASDIEQFTKLVAAESNIVVNGNRMGDAKEMPRVRFLTNRFMSLLISRVCKQAIPDTQCGFRYISCDILKQLHLTSSDFEIETEVLIKASKLGYKIFSVPIKTIYSNEESKINPVKDTFRFFSYLMKELRSPVAKK